jgi:hypothetical protein
MANAQPGTFEACLSTAALPAINPGAANRNTCQNGKFQGITASTTPIGLNVTKLLRASVSTGSRASSRAAFCAKNSQHWAHFCTSPIPSRKGLPISRAIRRASSSALSRRIFAADCKCRPRSSNDFRRQPRNAWCARTMAPSTSPRAMGS